MKLKYKIILFFGSLLIIALAFGYLEYIKAQETDDLGVALRVLTEQAGGTGTSTYVVGDILYSDATNKLDSLSIGTNNQVLEVNSTIPSWTSSLGDDTTRLFGIWATEGHFSNLYATTSVISTITGSLSVSTTTVTGDFTVQDSDGTDILYVDNNDHSVMVTGNATTTGSQNIGSLTAASCDVKSDTNGLLYCGTDQGAGASSQAWEYIWSGAISPTTTNVGLFVNGSSTINSTLRVTGKATTTQALWIGSGGTATNIDLAGGDLYIQDDLEVDGILYGDGTGLTSLDASDLVLEASDDWTGLFDGQEGTYYSNWDNLVSKPATSSILSLLDSDYRIEELHVTTTETDVLTVNTTVNLPSESIQWADIADVPTSTTDDLNEGSSNLYYTQARVWDDVWASTTLATILTTDANTTYTGGTNLTLAGTTFNVDDAFIVNDANDTMAGVLTADGLTLGANENITLGAQTLDHDGTDFVFNDSVNVTGELDTTGDISASTDGATTASPRVFGYKNLSAGEAARFQFGDEHNGLQNAYANDVQLYSYWGLVLMGGRQNYNTGFVPPHFQKTLDTGVLVMSDTTGVGNDSGSSGNPITTLGIMATTSQWADLTAWMDDTGTALSVVDYAGNFTIGSNVTSTNALHVVGTTLLTGNASTTGSLYMGEICMSDGCQSTLAALGGTANWDTMINKPATSTVLTLLDSDYRIEELHATTSEIDTLTINTTINLPASSVDFSDDTNATDGTGITFTDDSIAADLGTAIVTGEITDGTILEADLNVSNSPTDNYVLSYNDAASNFTWIQDATGAGGFAWTDQGSYVATSTVVAFTGGFFSTASSSIVANFRIDGNATTTGSFSVADFTITGALNLPANAVTDAMVSDTLTVTGYMQDTDIDSFSELQSWASDKTLVNEEDIFTIDANWVNTANPWAANEITEADPNVDSHAEIIAIIDNTATDVGTGVWTFAGVTLAANENITLGAQTIDHNGTDFVFNDDINSTGFIIGSADISEAELEILDGATITTAETDTLSDGSDADALHVHSGASLNDDVFLKLAGDVATAGTYNFGSASVIFELPNAAAPVADAAGEMHLDTTDNQLQIADSGNTERVFAVPEFRLFSFVLASTSPDFVSGGIIDIPKNTKDGRDITQYRCHVDGGTSVVVNISDGTNDTESIPCATTQTSDTNVATNSTFSADELWEVQIGAVTGVVDYLIFEAYGYITVE